MMLLGVNLLSTSAWVLVTLFSFRAIGAHFSLLSSLLITPLRVYSGLASITPGSLGISEAVVVFSARIFNITPAQSLVATGLIRSTELFLFFTLGPIFSYLLIHKTGPEAKDGNNESP